MPVKAAKGKGKGRKGGVKGPKKAPNKAITLALGHPPAVGPWNPLPLDQQIDAFAGAIAKPNAVVTSTAGGPTLCGRGILSSGKPAAPPRYFVPTRDAAIAAITKAAEARRQRELAAANQETEAASAATAATHASAAAFRAGSLHSNAQYCAMARTLSCLRENIEAETSKGNSGTTKTLDPTAIGERRMYTELQRQLLLLQQPNAPTSHLRQLEAVYRWYKRSCCPQQQQQQRLSKQQQPLEQEKGEEAAKHWGGSLDGPTEEPVAGSVFWKPPVDSPLLERAPSVTQQWQQQQHQDEGPVESGFCKYVYSHTPLCTPADKLRLYRINLLFRPRPLVRRKLNGGDSKQQQPKQRPWNSGSNSSSRRSPFAYQPAHGQPPWGLVLPDQEGQTEDPTPAPMRPRQWQFEGKAMHSNKPPREWANVGAVAVTRVVSFMIWCFGVFGAPCSSAASGRAVVWAEWGLGGYVGSDRRSLIQAQLHARWLAGRQREQAQAECAIPYTARPSDLYTTAFYAVACTRGFTVQPIVFAAQERGDTSKGERQRRQKLLLQERQRQRLQDQGHTTRGVRALPDSVHGLHPKGRRRVWAGLSSSMDALDQPSAAAKSCSPRSATAATNKKSYEAEATVVSWDAYAQRGCTVGTGRTSRAPATPGAAPVAAANAVSSGGPGRGNKKAEIAKEGAWKEESLEL
ncbi:uncharacterized protein LOC113147100 [Cyclospora cayetanensis]|uniref:Uncharacterized protein LOC113147100 n=1 Tax=Cyclospora cayetanensis TaxID=88456 RepID=A0A6P6RXH8_9EIME|nr:uncharacterized protein LOC113147100 [Cyclospora cayetanensis]